MSERADSIGFEAALLHCGYRLGYFSREDIEHWADRQIERLEQPSLELIELAILRGKNDIDILALLSRISADLDPRLSTELTIGMAGKLYRDGKVALEVSVRTLFSLVFPNRDRLLTNHEMGAIYCLDDGYDHAMHDGYFTIEQVEKDFLSFTEPVSDRCS